MTDVTHILNAIEGGDARATDELLPLVYEALRRLAAQRLSQEPPGQTLQATALVHEAYIRLLGAEGELKGGIKGVRYIFRNVNVLTSGSRGTSYLRPLSRALSFHLRS